MSARRNRTVVWGRWILSAVAIAAASLLVSGQSITVPNTFVNGTVADANQVNANFTSLAANALNRNAGTMLGPLSSRDVIPTSDNTYDVGSATFAFRDLYVKRNTVLNGQTYSWPSAHGASGAALTENGSGTLAWFTAGAIGRCDLRLSLTTGTPVTTNDVTAATSVFVTPTPGKQCAFYDGSASWAQLSGIAEVTVAVPATTSTMYDVFCFNNSGTMACDSAVAWTNDATRATALATQDMVYVKSGTTTRRYIGSFRTTTVSGQTEDSLAKRYVWNYYNRVDSSLQAALETADSWPYTTATWRQANANAANQVDVVVGWAEDGIEVVVQAGAVTTAGTANARVAIGEDVTNAPAAKCLFGNTTATLKATLQASLRKVPAVGRHFYAWLEFSDAAGTTTWYGDDSGTNQNGISGSFRR